MLRGPVPRPPRAAIPPRPDGGGVRASSTSASRLRHPRVERAATPARRPALRRPAALRREDAVRDRVPRDDRRLRGRRALLLVGVDLRRLGARWPALGLSLALVVGPLALGPSGDRVERQRGSPSSPTGCTSSPPRSGSAESRRSRSSCGRSRRRLRRRRFVGFARLAVGLVGVIVVAGVYLALAPAARAVRISGRPRYGQLLLLKIAIVAIALVWGGIHHFVVRPRLEAGDQPRVRAEPRRARPLVAVAVLLAAAMLTNAAPPPVDTARRRRPPARRGRTRSWPRSRPRADRRAAARSRSRSRSRPRTRSSRSSAASSPGASPCSPTRCTCSPTTSRSRSRSSPSGSRRSRRRPSARTATSAPRCSPRSRTASLLVALAIWIFVEAVQRLRDPPEILGGWMLAIALVGIGVNVAAGRRARACARAQPQRRGGVPRTSSPICSARRRRGRGRGHPRDGLARGRPAREHAHRRARARELVVDPPRLDRDPPRGDAPRHRRACGRPAPRRGAGSRRGARPPHLDDHVRLPGALGARARRPGEDCHGRRRELERVLEDEFGIEHTTLQVDHAATRRARSRSGASSGHGRDQHGSPAERAAPEPVERLVRLLERERLDLGAHRERRREREELLAVGAGEVRDGADVRSPHRSS